jgi:hypothetical protein
MTANRTNLQYALANWLNSSSTPDTQVWIWIFCHGAGLFHHSPLYYTDPEWWSLEMGRVEENSDEGSEINEVFIGGSNRMVGIDEGLYLSPSSGGEIIWDDEFKDWLRGVNYGRMVIFIGACRSVEASENETGSCFGGGFIDDLSAPRRIIISPANETYYSYFNFTTGMGYFVGPFMDALTVYSQAWNESCDSIDVDGATSVLEAYEYAYNHDLARKAVRDPSGDPNNDPWKSIYGDIGARSRDESPWLDDGGNFLPTFANGTDVGVGLYGYDSGDGGLASHTWLVPGRYTGCTEDVNDDGKVDIIDVLEVAQTYGCGYPSTWWSRASCTDVNHDNKVDIKDVLMTAKQYGWHV